jgi:hypothetical protein
MWHIGLSTSCQLLPVAACVLCLQEVTRLLAECSALKQQLADAELAAAAAAPAARTSLSSIPLGPWGHTQQQQQQQQIAAGLSSPRAAAAEASRSLSPLGGSSSSRVASRQPSLHQQLSNSALSGVRSPTLSRHVSFHEPCQPTNIGGDASLGVTAGQAAAGAAAFSLSPFSSAAGVAGGDEQGDAASGLAAAAARRSLAQSEWQGVGIGVLCCASLCLHVILGFKGMLWLAKMHSQHDITALVTVFCGHPFRMQAAASSQTCQHSNWLQMLQQP